MGIKLFVFIELCDMFEYLVEKLKEWGYVVVIIYGGMNMDERIRVEYEFKNKV